VKKERNAPWGGRKKTKKRTGDPCLGLLQRYTPERESEGRGKESLSFFDEGEGDNPWQKIQDPE